MKKRAFTKEFKLSILRELESKSAAEVCREHNIGQSLLSKWKGDFEKNPSEAFKGNGIMWKDNARLVHYERLIGQLYAEIDLLKKTTNLLQERKAEQKRRLLQ